MEPKGKSPTNIRRIESQIDSEEKFQPFVQIDEKAVFIEYNPKLAIEKFMGFSEIKQFEEKLQYVKHLADLFEESHAEIAPHLGPIVEKILKESNEEITLSFTQQVAPIARVLHSV